MMLYCRVRGGHRQGSIGIVNRALADGVYEVRFSRGHCLCCSPACPHIGAYAEVDVEVVASAETFAGLASEPQRPSRMFQRGWWTVTSMSGYSCTGGAECAKIQKGSPAYMTGTSGDVVCVCCAIRGGVAVPGLVVAAASNVRAEAPCGVCGRKNDLGVKVCWSCGNRP